jgi:bifunctional non-homologous end joining protein LigD
MDKLNQYRQKRDFSRTSEPLGTTKNKDRGPIYVIQKHKARNMHYDLRLQMGGVLKSWAIPKGPSLNPSERKLAVPTEDHPLDYAYFEGVIPEGQYGAGTVIVWDKGSYSNLKEQISLEESIQKGKLEIFIEGQKLKGAYVLLRTGKKDDPSPRWLFIKMKDRYADSGRNPVHSEPQSVISGKTIEEMEKEPES